MKDENAKVTLKSADVIHTRTAVYSSAYLRVTALSRIRPRIRVRVSVSIRPRIRVRVSVSIVYRIATGGYSWIWPELH